MDRFVAELNQLPAIRVLQANDSFQFILLVQYFTLDQGSDHAAMHALLRVILVSMRPVTSSPNTDSRDEVNIDTQ